MNNGGFEIERKFLIEYPEKELLSQCSDISDIVQTYLISGEKGVSERVRKRGRDGEYTYTHTKKTHITHIRRLEIEKEIDEDSYNTLLLRADPDRSIIRKTRTCLAYDGQVFEIDLYPFWSDRAIMEIELENEEQTVSFPDGLHIIKEVTKDKRYTNASLARSVPYDDLR